ncbi:MAG TPA: hypothetical protein VHL11_20975, partial [Phototrophicaceae bacterium]|nr:hypothetical protein [Phototrophicaceae bacterium]
ARFGNTLDFGYQYLNDAGNIRQRRLTYGAFNPVFFFGNLLVATIRPPKITLNWNEQPALKIEPDAWGMGILWTCPLLLMAGIVFLNPSPDTSEKPENVLLAVTIVVVILPSLLYHNTGSAQFGYRFILDALPFWMILLARAARKIPLAILVPLTGYCMVVNLIGFYWIANLIEPH